MTVTIEALKPHPRPRRVALMGEGGAGKTTLLGLLARDGFKVGIIDVEDGLGPIETDAAMAGNIKVARCYKAGHGAVVQAWDAMLKDAELDIIALDTWSRMGGDLEYLEVDTSVGGFKPWQKLGHMLVKMLYNQVSSSKTVILLTHLEKTISRETGQIVSIAPKMPGQMAIKEFGEKFDFIWQVERDVDGASKSGYSHYLYTKATSVRATKSRLPLDMSDELPGKFPANDFPDVFRKFVMRTGGQQ